MLDAPDIGWLPASRLGTRLDANYNRSEAVNARAQLQSVVGAVELGGISSKVVCGPFGSTLTKKDINPKGEVVLVNPTDIAGPLFNTAPEWRITRETLAAKGLPLYAADTLVFARVGIYPHCGVIPSHAGDATISSRIIAAEIDQSKADPYFLTAFFRTKVGQIILYSIQKVTAQPVIGTTELKSATVPCPKLSLQIAIGNKLRSAVHLSDAAEQTIATLVRELETALCWPLQLDFSQMGFASSGDLGARIDPLPYLPRFRAIRSLFQDSQGKSLAELGGHAANGCEVRNFVAEGRRYLVVGDMDTWHLSSPTNWSLIPNASCVPDKAIPSDGDLLCVRTGPVGRMVSWEPAYGDAVLSSHWIRIRGDEALGFDAAYIALVSQLEAWEMMMQAIVYGAVQPQISQEEILQVPIPFVGTDLAARCGRRYREAVADAFRAKGLAAAAISDVEQLITGDLDEGTCIRIGRELAVEFSLKGTS